MAGMFDDPAAFGLKPGGGEPAAAAPAEDKWNPAAFGMKPTGEDGGGVPAQILASGKDAYGHPLQSMRATPASDVVGQTTGTPIAEGKLPGMGTQAVLSLPVEMEQRRRVAAGQLFPGMPLEQSLPRVFFGPDRRMAAVGQDGKAFYVDPTPYFPDVAHPSTLIPDNIGARVGGMAGGALPAIGGVAGGALAAPSSMFLGPAGAALGAGAGDVVRQGLASRFDPQPSIQYDPWQTAGEAGGAAAGQALGAGLLRVAAPNRLGASVLDLSKVRVGPTMAEAERINRLAEQQGIRLTPGQLTGLPSLLSHEDTIASGSAGPGLADVAGTAYQKQRGEITGAFSQMADRISSAADKTDAAQSFQQGAEDATRLTRQNANAAARPAYQAAERAGQVMSPDLAQLADVPAVKSAIDAARADYANLYRKAAPDTPDFALWNLAKQKLDDAVGTARRAGENTTAMAFDSLRGDLLTHLDAAYPTYGTARELSAPGQRLSARLADTANVTPGGTFGNERARAIVAPVFEQNNPRAIAEARDAFTAAGRGAEWNAGTRAYLQDMFDTASKSEGGLNPQMLRRQIWGDANKRAALQAAMEPAQFQGLDNFMQVVEAAARSRGMNSLTAPRLAGANALNEAATHTPGQAAANMAAAALTPSKLIGAVGAPFARLGEWLKDRELTRISERLFSPEGMQYLREMGGLGSGTQRAIVATTNFLGGEGGGAAVSAAENRFGPRNRLAP